MGGGWGSSFAMEQELIHAPQFHSKYRIRKSIQTGYGIYYMYSGVGEDLEVEYQILGVYRKVEVGVDRQISGAKR